MDFIIGLTVGFTFGSWFGIFLACVLRAGRER